MDHTSRIAAIQHQSTNLTGALVQGVRDLNDIAEEIAEAGLADRQQTETLCTVACLAGQLDAAIQILRSITTSTLDEAGGDGITHIG